MQNQPEQERFVKVHHWTNSRTTMFVDDENIVKDVAVTCNRSISANKNLKAKQDQIYSEPVYKTVAMYALLRGGQSARFSRMGKKRTKNLEVVWNAAMKAACELLVNDRAARAVAKTLVTERDKYQLNLGSIRSEIKYEKSAMAAYNEFTKLASQKLYEGARGHRLSPPINTYFDETSVIAKWHMLKDPQALKSVRKLAALTH